jgi:hypothetical protein
MNQGGIASQEIIEARAVEQIADMDGSRSGQSAAEATRLAREQSHREAALQTFGNEMAPEEAARSGDRKHGAHACFTTAATGSDELATT